jgi:hypothetical protein
MLVVVRTTTGTRGGRSRIVNVATIGDGGPRAADYREAVRLTQFRELMTEEFGAARAAALSRDHVFAELGGRTVEEALEAGIDPRKVWLAVCEVYEVPPARR